MRLLIQYPSDEDVIEVLTYICSNPALLSVHRKFSKTLCWRTVFMTRAERNPFKLVGIGPRSMRLGDEIILVAGARASIVVR